MKQEGVLELCLLLLTSAHKQPYREMVKLRPCCLVCGELMFWDLAQVLDLLTSLEQGTLSVEVEGVSGCWQHGEDTGTVEITSLSTSLLAAEGITLINRVVMILICTQIINTTHCYYSDRWKWHPMRTLTMWIHWGWQYLVLESAYISK